MKDRNDAMDSSSPALLPRRVADYIHEMGVRALDHLATRLEASKKTAGRKRSADGAAAAGLPEALQALVGRWVAMAPDEKQRLVAHVTDSVIEVIVESSALPLGLKLGKRAAKATKKVIVRQTKKLRKIAKKGETANKRKDKKKKKSGAGAEKNGAKKQEKG